MNDKLVRSFDAELTEGDGRTVDLRIVPYNTVARVSDPPLHEPYDEMWLPGVFSKQMRAANRVDLVDDEEQGDAVFMNFEHDQSLRGIIGHGVELRDEPDGLHGTFRVHDNDDGEKALYLVRERLMRGVSLEAVAHRSTKRGGVTARAAATLRAVALCRRPAYQGAQVLAVRTEPVDPIEPAKPMPDETVERLRAIGITPVVVNAVVRRAWDPTADRFTDDEYQQSCLIDLGGDAPAKERCLLPLLEPNGDLNANALTAAAHALTGRASQLAPAAKAAAARRLVRFYRQADMTPPPSLQTLART